MADPNPVPTADDLRRRFTGPASLTIGIEEEVMLLDPESLDLAPVAPAVLDSLGADPRFKLELPAGQLELITGAHESVPAAIAELAEARRDLLAAVEGRLRVAGAGVHPFAAARGELNEIERYAETISEFAEVARRQLVFGLHVHVAVGGPERSVAVYNALRGHLPELAALGANAPFYEGGDTGLASVRPLVSQLLPRQGVPPAVRDFDDLADAFAWASDGTFSPRRWWWEARLHPFHGTIEVRVPDTQTTLEDAEALSAVIHALVSRLAARHDAGERLPAEPAWKIEENRWSACRHGTGGSMADLATGRREPTRARLERLLDGLEGEARSLGCEAGLRAGARLLDRNGAVRQREVAAEAGLQGMTAWLADAYAPVAV